MISTSTLHQAMWSSPQQGAGVRRLARALGIEPGGLSRIELCRRVARAAAVDSAAGQLERMALRETGS